MQKTLTCIRVFFVLLCVFLLMTYTATVNPEGINFSTAVIGIAAGLCVGLSLVSIDILLKRFSLYSFNIALLGLFCGYLMGEALWNIITASISFKVAMESDVFSLYKLLVYLPCAYFGMVLTVRASDQLHLSIPFIKLKSSNSKKKDLLIDWSILLDSRILDITSSGLLDNYLIVPRFMLKELFVMAENVDENVRTKARRCLEIFKKLETMGALELRYSDLDFPDIKDTALKLIQAARALDCNIITSDIARLQQYAVDGVKIINIHMLSNALKPITGEQLSIKIQRYGKEPRQGIGYLEDGTMVVVNGGAEYIGETMKAQILSVKHTSSGRMIFCNAANDFMLDASSLVHSEAELENTHKNYFAL